MFLIVVFIIMTQCSSLVSRYQHCRGIIPSDCGIVS